MKPQSYVSYAAYNPNSETFAKQASCRPINCVGLGILSGFRLGALGLARDENSSLPVAYFRITLLEKEKLESMLPVRYKISEVDMLNVKTGMFYKTNVILPVENLKNNFEPSQDDIKSVQDWLWKRFPEASLGAALVGHGDVCDLCYYNMFKRFLTGEARSSARERTTWGGAGFVISPETRPTKNVNLNIPHIQRTPEECAILVNFMHKMLGFIPPNDGKWSSRWFVAMLGEECAKFAKAPFPVLCDALCKRASEILKETLTKASKAMQSHI